MEVDNRVTAIRQSMTDLIDELEDEIMDKTDGTRRWSIGNEEVVKLHERQYRLHIARERFDKLMGTKDEEVFVDRGVGHPPYYG